MQDKYVGDIGDYGKLILLREIQRQTKLRLGVVWCYVSGASEKNKDGLKREFLQYSGKQSVRHCDPALFDAFAQFRKLENHKVLGLHPFLPNANFFNEPADKMHRPDWLHAALSAMQNDELVFFDPDNGISSEKEVSHKHVNLDELSQFWARKQSLLIYHHLSRKPGGHGSEQNELRNLFEKRLKGSEVIPFRFRRGTARVFFLVIHPVHRNRFPDFSDREWPWHALTMTKREWASLMKQNDIFQAALHD